MSNDKRPNRLIMAIRQMFNLDLMPRPFKQLALVQNGYTLFTSLSGVFVSLFLFQNGNGMRTVALFTLLQLLFGLAQSPLTAFIAKKGGSLFILRFGIIMQNLYYLTLLLFREQASAYLAPLSLFACMAGNTYMVGYHSLVIAYADVGVREVCISFVQFISAIIGIVIPTASSYVIASAPGNIGYFIVFALSFSLSAVIMVYTFRLKKTPVTGKTSFQPAIRAVARDREWLVTLFAGTLRGTRESMMGFLTSLLLFELVGNETIIGWNSFLVGIGGIVSNYLALKLLKPKNRLQAMIITTVLMLAGGGLLMLLQTPVTLIAFNIANGILMNIFLIPATGIFYKYVNRLSREHDNLQETISMHEIFLNLGRAAGVAAIFLVPQTTRNYLIVLVVTSAIQVVSSIMLRWADRRIDAREAEDLARQAQACRPEAEPAARG